MTRPNIMVNIYKIYQNSSIVSNESDSNLLFSILPLRRAGASLALLSTSKQKIGLRRLFCKSLIDTKLDASCFASDSRSECRRASLALQEGLNRWAK